eukprot:g6181.t1
MQRSLPFASLSWRLMSHRVHPTSPILRMARAHLGRYKTFSTAATVPQPMITATTSDKIVGCWLLGCAGMVSSMVLVGGLTRLTSSGLSMTDWKPQGSLPPQTLEEWNKEFSQYKKFPQWKRGNTNMTLSEFKYIYYWEWGHRMLGRATGMVFLVPLTTFGMAGMIRRSMWPRLLSLGALGGLQGLIGWWMVKSGLDAKTFDFDKEQKEARVNPYRLATHLSMAFCLHAGLIWTAMDHFFGFQPSLRNAVASMPGLYGTGTTGPLAAVRRVKFIAVSSTFLLGATVFAGALVAGNDAGRAYNTFPLMQGRVFPPSEDAFRYFPRWRNWFESTALTQWNHRVLGMSTAASMVGLLLMSRNPSAWKALSTMSRRCILLLSVGATAQASLGVAALLNYVPVYLGSMHQCGALTLWTIGIMLCHSLRPLRVRGGGRLFLERFALKLASK